MMRGSGPTQRRRLVRALDELTVRWATNNLPASCRWLLNTQLLFLPKSREPTAKQFDDEEWLRAVQDDVWQQDIAEDDVDSYGDEVEADAAVPMEGVQAAGERRSSVAVRPIQIGEFLRRWVSRRLLALSRDVDGSVECSVTLGNIATKTRQSIHAMQRSGALPWATSRPDGPTEAMAEFDERQTRAAAWAALEPAQRRSSEGSKTMIPDPRHEIQGSGGIADFWYLDDGDVLIDARLVPVYLAAFDRFNPEAGSTRNRPKTEVVYYMSEDVLR